MAGEAGVPAPTDSKPAAQSWQNRPAMVWLAGMAVFLGITFYRAATRSRVDAFAESRRAASRTAPTEAAGEANEEPPPRQPSTTTGAPSSRPSGAQSPRNAGGSSDRGAAAASAPEAAGQAAASAPANGAQPATAAKGPSSSAPSTPIGALASRAAKELRDRDGRIAVCMAENEQLSRKLEGLGAKPARLDGASTADAEVARHRAALEDVRRLRSQAAERAAQLEKLASTLEPLRRAGALEVAVRENRMVVELRDQILFDPGRTDIKPEGQAALRQVAAVLAALPDRDFQVAGHTDDTPIRSKRFASNWHLSTARAVEVLGFMVSSGMDAGRLSAAGYADQSPVSANDSPEARARNRRIEITVLPNRDELPPLARPPSGSVENR